MRYANKLEKTVIQKMRGVRVRGRRERERGEAHLS